MEEKRRFYDFDYAELIILRKALENAGFSVLCNEVQKEIEIREESK